MGKKDNDIDPATGRSRSETPRLMRQMAESRKKADAAIKVANEAGKRRKAGQN